jgi:hypothetical protein
MGNLLKVYNIILTPLTDNLFNNTIYRYMACFKSTIGASGLVTTTLICIY